MRIAIPLLLLFLLLPSAAEAAGAADELLRRQAEAWNAGDLEGFCAAYAEDALFVTPQGVTRGRREVLERYRGRYRDRASMGRLSFETLDVREGSGSISVAARWSLEYADRPTASGYTLLVMHSLGGRLLIVQDASM